MDTSILRFVRSFSAVTHRSSVDATANITVRRSDQAAIAGVDGINRRKPYEADTNVMAAPAAGLRLRTRQPTPCDGENRQNGQCKYSFHIAPLTLTRSRHQAFRSHLGFRAGCMTTNLPSEPIGCCLARNRNGVIFLSAEFKADPAASRREMHVDRTRHRP